MNLEKVIFGFFITFACSLNFGFVTGDIGDPELHNTAELVAALIVSLVATVLKFMPRSWFDAVVGAQRHRKKRRR